MVENIESTVKLEPQNPIENETLANDLDTIREKHQQNEVKRKQEVFEFAIQEQSLLYLPMIRYKPIM